MTNCKPRVIVPKNPTTYYGTTINIEELSETQKIFLGDFNRVDEFIVEEVVYDEKLNSYEIHTDKAVLLASPLTRLACSALA